MIAIGVVEFLKELRQANKVFFHLLPLLGIDGGSRVFPRGTFT